MDPDHHTKRMNLRVMIRIKVTGKVWETHWKRIGRCGKSYHVLLPKALVEFYGWNKKAVTVEVRGEEIIIRQVKGVNINRLPDITQFTTATGRVITMLPAAGGRRKKRMEEAMTEHAA